MPVAVLCEGRLTCISKNEKNFDDVEKSIVITDTAGIHAHKCSYNAALVDLFFEGS